jgi:hypothetical protein
MPAKSKSQRRLFAIALQYKRGELKKDEVSDEVIELSKQSEEVLKDYAKTKEDNLPDKVEEAQGVSVGGMPFGHEWASTANSIGPELAAIKRDKAEDEAEEDQGGKKSKKNTKIVKTFQEFHSDAKQLQEMEGMAATTTNTPGMGNVSPGEIGSYEDDEEDDEDKRKAKSHEDFHKWKKQRSKSQKGKKSKNKTEVARPAWELGGNMPKPVVNTIK